MSKPQLYFQDQEEWYAWLEENHQNCEGVQLIFYKLSTGKPTMRWEEAVKVALCFGWIDSTVKSLGNGKRKQYFCPRNPNSAWSAVNKNYIEELTASGRMAPAGMQAVEAAKENGSWSHLDDVENGVVPSDLQSAFEANKLAFQNFQRFSPSYRKSYLYWLNQAKRESTRKARIEKIIELCEQNIKSRN